jgi:hypothetical protein
MIYLKEYNNYDNQVAEICKKFGIENWSIRDGLVDVDGNVDLWHIGLTKLPLKFGRVSGFFNCSDNKLTTLEGAPKEVGGNFNCSNNNNLTSLEGAPKEVGGDFSCYNNNLTSLEGAPKEVGVYFDCSMNKLSSLEGAPEKVGGNFHCSLNDLTSLEGAPKKVGGYFDCRNNKLTSLEGAPKEVGGYFSCWNNELTSLEGGPKEVSGNFSCRDNKLTSLEGAPEKVGGYFECDEFKLFRGEWNLKGCLKILRTGSEKAKDLVLTIIGAEELNREIEKDPEGMMVKLKGVWNSPWFASTRKDLVIPDRYKEDMETLADLDALGF